MPGIILGVGILHRETKILEIIELVSCWGRAGRQTGSK